MSEMKHTKGPWRFIGKQTGYIMGSDGVGRFGPREVQVGTVGAYRDKELLRFSRERWDADGALISAAPDMADALESAPIRSKYHGANGFEEARFFADYDAFMAKRRAALQKATPPEIQ